MILDEYTFQKGHDSAEEVVKEKEISLEQSMSLGNKTERKNAVE